MSICPSSLVGDTSRFKASVSLLGDHLNSARHSHQFSDLSCRMMRYCDEIIIFVVYRLKRLTDIVCVDVLRTSSCKESVIEE